MACSQRLFVLVGPFIPLFMFIYCWIWMQCLSLYLQQLSTKQWHLFFNLHLTTRCYFKYMFYKSKFGSSRSVLRTYAIFQNLWFVVTRLQSYLRQFVWSLPWYGQQLRNICVTNDHIYVSFVVITILSFSHSRFITGFITRWVPRLELKLLTFLCSVLYY